MEPGERVDRFVVEERLGRGGMASVYKVRHTGLGSTHALKVLDLSLPSVRGRLVTEGRVQAALAHPNIVAVTDLVEVAGAPGLIMEYVAGPSLEAWLRDHRPDAATADAIFLGILDAVAHAHRQGLVHRDLKPGNVLLQTVDGRLVPKVSDFGLVKLLDEDPGERRTRSGFAMGTPGYMAPEQIRSAKDVDARADVFALGCILFELWCGRRPFEGDSVYDVLVAIERKDRPDPRTLRPDLPAGVERAVLGCLEPDRATRLASVDAVRAALGEGTRPPTSSSSPATVSPATTPPVSTLPPEVGERAGHTFSPTVAAPPVAPRAPAPARSSTGLWIVLVVVVAVAALGTTALVATGMFVGLMAGAMDTGF